MTLNILHNLEVLALLHTQADSHGYTWLKVILKVTILTYGLFACKSL